MISTEELYHFTPEFEYLKSILQNGIRVSYCLEDMSWVKKYYGYEVLETWMGGTVSDKQLDVAVPMACFCDIPENLRSSHTKMYGNYGVGIKKDFAKDLALNPMFYLKQGSSAVSILQALHSTSQRIPTNVPEYSITNLIGKLMSYFKPFEGHFRGVQNHKYYDEREWRYVPPNDFYPVKSKEDFEKLDPEDRVVDYLEIQLKDLINIIVTTEEEKAELILINPAYEKKIKIYSNNF